MKPLAIFVTVTCAILAAADAARSAEPPITAAAFSPDGEHVVAGTEASIAVYGWPSLERQREIPAALAHVYDIAFAADGKSLAIAGGEPGASGGFQQFHWPSGRALAEQQPLPDVAYQLAWTADDTQLALAGGDGQLVLAALDGKVIRRFVGHSRDVLSVSLAADSALFVSASGDHTVRVWHASSGELVRTLANHTGQVRDLELRPPRDGLPVVASAGGDKTVRFWQPTIGRMLRFAKLPSSPLAIAWTPAGDRLVAACEDGHLRVVDAATARVVQDSPTIDGWPYALAISPGGESALIGGEAGQIRRVALAAHHDG